MKNSYAESMSRDLAERSISKKLVERAEQEANLQGLRVSDIVEKALKTYLATQTAKRSDNRYLLWHVERKSQERGKGTNSKFGVLRAMP